MDKTKTLLAIVAASSFSASAQTLPTHSIYEKLLIPYHMEPVLLHTYALKGEEFDATPYLQQIMQRYNGNAHHQKQKYRSPAQRFQKPHTIRSQTRKEHYNGVRRTFDNQNSKP